MLNSLIRLFVQRRLAKLTSDTRGSLPRDSNIPLPPLGAITIDGARIVYGLYVRLESGRPDAAV